MESNSETRWRETMMHSSTTCLKRFLSFFFFNILDLNKIESENIVEEEEQDQRENESFAETDSQFQQGK